jgi:F0F1-type ATP synthase alpha subunit
MTEILKQPEYQPMPVEEQVVILYAGSSGALDTVPLNRVAEFEKKYLAHLRANHGDVLESLRAEKKWTDALQKKLDDVVTRLRSEFLA